MSYIATLRKSLNDNLQQLESELLSSNNDLPHLLDSHPYQGLDDAENLPTKKAFDLVNQIRVDLKALDALITPNQVKLVELGTLHYKVAALNTAVVLNVADAIESLGGEAPLQNLAMHVETNEHKLGRIMRVLTADFIFQEISHNVFKNTRHSIALSSLGARSFLSFISTDLGMKCSTGISKDLSAPDTKHSFSEKKAPFCKVVSRNEQTFAEFMTDPENAEMVTLGTEGIVGWLNKLTRAALLCDYPWAELGNATVIDIGCGAGDSGMDVIRKFPQLTWVYQDLEPVIEGLEKTFPENLKEKVENGKISFVVQDYFQPNLSNGNVWYLRGVLHEYDDKELLDILTHLTAAMRRTPGSRMIINEVLNSSPTIIPASSNSPPSTHIPESQSATADMANRMTWSTFSLFGGKERSYQEYEQLLNEAGLKISRFFQFRTFTVMLECQLA